MHTITTQVLEHITQLPPGVPIMAKELLHLGSRATIDQVLSRLVRKNILLRVGRGIYALPVQSRFGIHVPSTTQMVENLAHQRGETIVPHGAAAANLLGLTTQMPMKAIYLTSGRNRQLKLGAQVVEFRHAPIWQLIFPNRPAGQVIRALAWLGPTRAGKALRRLRTTLSSAELKEIASVRACLPTWMAKEVSCLVTHD